MLGILAAIKRALHLAPPRGLLPSEPGEQTGTPAPVAPGRPTLASAAPSGVADPGDLESSPSTPTAAIAAGGTATGQHHEAQAEAASSPPVDGQTATRGMALPTAMTSPRLPLAVGDPAPDFALPSDQGVPVQLADLRGQRVLVYFYPMDDTPGCTTQACGFRDAYVEIQERNAIVLGISPDDAASHQAFKTKYDLPFTLLVDADHVVAEVYGVWSADGGYIKRSQFLVDEAGKLVDVQVPVQATESVRRALEALGA